MKFQLALSCAVASIGFLSLPLFSGNDILPETRICFRPKTVLSEKNQYLKKCDSEERVAVVLSSVFRDLDKSDIEFHNKVADNPATKHFDNNLTQSQISQLIAIAFGIGGVGLFSSLEKEVIENKNSIYQNKRVGILTNEATAHQQLYGYDSQTPALQQELKNQTFIRDVAKLQSESAEFDEKTATHKSKIKKLFSGNKSADFGDKLESKELELDSNYLWYNRILNEPCKVITGVSGSGKSTFEHALIQLARQDNQNIVVLYPNTTRKAKNGSKVLSEAEDINAFLESFPQMIVDRKNEAKDKGIDEDDYLDYCSENQSKIAIFAMEINNWEASGVDPELIAAFYKLAFVDIRKWGVTLTMTGQSINQGSVASKLASFSKLLGQQTKIECQATTSPETGKTISKGVAKVKFSDKEDSEELELCFYKPKDKTKY